MISSGVRPRVLVALSDFPQACLDLLETKCDVTVMSCTEHPIAGDVLKLLPNKYDAFLGKIEIDPKFLDVAGNELKIISTPTAGFDHMDVAEIKKRGIKVGNTPQVTSAAVAEIAIFLLLGATRRVREGQLLLEENRTKVRLGLVQRLYGLDLWNKIVGIVGLGGVGAEILKRLRAFEIKKCVYTGHSRKKIDDLDAEFVSLNDLLNQSDFVIVSVSLNSETEKMFNDTVFQKMKKTAVLVNVSRGKTVDTEALVRALKNGTIFAAGLDVTDPEPLPLNHELLKLPNAHYILLDELRMLSYIYKKYIFQKHPLIDYISTVVIPHMGTLTIDTRTDMAMAAVQNILDGLEGKPLPYEL